MEDCLFCNIIKGNIPSTKVYENEYVYAFRDINPMAKVHVLVIPKVHIASVNGINETNIEVLSHIFLAIKEIVKIENIEQSGYRVVTNCGDDACQSVHHLHFHILGGNKLEDKMA